jgi:hypothetical protein
MEIFVIAGLSGHGTGLNPPTVIINPSNYPRDRLPFKPYHNWPKSQWKLIPGGMGEIHHPPPIGSTLIVTNMKSVVAFDFVKIDSRHSLRSMCR